MNRTRNTTEPVSKQSTIASISSNIPLMATKLEGDTQFSTKPSSNTPATNVESFLNSLKTNTTTNHDSKRSRTICQPKGTIPYTVGNSDTLEKIALHFNLTPSELLQLNKLNTRMVFPGQVLFVPDESSLTTPIEQQSSTVLPVSPPLSLTKAKDGDAFTLLADRRLSHDLSPTNTQQDIGAMIWSMSRQSTAKPGRAERLKSEASTESESSSRTIEDRLKTHKEDNSKQVQQLQTTFSIEENQQLDEECLQRFIKVNVRLMTEDRKNVAGVLLVTPNAVMFDPDVLDPLVKEHGIDKYGLIIRMDLLAGIALYEDIVMYEHEATLRDEEKRKMCHSSSIKNLHQSSTISTNNDEEQVHDLMSSLLDNIDKEFNSSTNSSRILFNASSNNRRRISSDHQLFDNDELFYSLDDNKHSIGVLIDEKDTALPNYQLENCVPNDDFNKRFGEIDKLLQKQHEIYVTPHPIEIPYYLCIKTSTLVHDIVSIHERQNKKRIDNVYGKKELDQEYWFSVPKEKIDHLYAFFLRWSPERALDPYFNDDYPDNSNTSLNHSNRHASHMQSKHNEISSGKGFVLLTNDDPELTDNYLSPNNNNKNNNSSRNRTLTTSSDSGIETKKQHYLKRQNTLLKEWEIISVDEIYRRINSTHANRSHTPDIGIPPPKLLQPSTLIDEEQSKQILLELPARVHGLNWKMLFSTEAHGFSLNQLYRRSMEVDQDSPALLIVKDVEQNIFGAYISQQLLVSEGFYGNGESFLFTIHPQFQVFHWTGNNQFFVKGDVKTLGIGSGEGTYGLWLDADLYHGRTCPSKTFDNVRLSSKEDFIIASVEVWTFID